LAGREDAPAVPTLFIIRANAEGGYDVHGRDLLPKCEWAARLSDLLCSGWSEAEAFAELESMEKPRQLNTKPQTSLRLVREYVATYSEPGDWLVDNDQVSLVGKQGFA
jgi:hypothetical protein